MHRVYVSAVKGTWASAGEGIEQLRRDLVGIDNGATGSPVVVIQVVPVSVENWAAFDPFSGVHISVVPLASVATVPPL